MNRLLIQFASLFFSILPLTSPAHLRGADSGMQSAGIVFMQPFSTPPDAVAARLGPLHDKLAKAVHDAESLATQAPVRREAISCSFDSVTCRDGSKPTP